MRQRAGRETTRPCTSFRGRGTRPSSERPRRSRLLVVPVNPSLVRGGRCFVYSGNEKVPISREYLAVRVCERYAAFASRGDSRRRGTSRVPQICPRCVRVFSRQTTISAALQALNKSPLTDSNRRPPPYHGGFARCYVDRGNPL